MSMLISRRDMLRTAAVAAAFGPPVAVRRGAEHIAERETEHCRHRHRRPGAADVNGAGHENIVALCDVDEQRGGKTFERYPRPNGTRISASCWTRCTSRSTRS